MGKVQAEKFYNDAFDNDRNYNVHYSSCNYYQLWKDILKLIDVESSIMELGCGVGQFANLLFDTGAENYIGFDFSETAIIKARITNPYMAFVKMDFDKETPDYLQADEIIILETLEHLKDDIGLLKSIPVGKKVLFTVPTFDGTAHERFFTDEKMVLDRYDKLFDRIEFYPFGNYFVYVGRRI
jgi:SAM-dependent methyltransferase